jgi:hypothetical protein
VTDYEENDKFHRRILGVVEWIVKEMKETERRLHALEQKVGVVQLPAGSVDGDKNSDPQYCRPAS